MPIPCQTGTKPCQSVRIFNQTGDTIVSLSVFLFSVLAILSSCGSEPEGIDLRHYFFNPDSLEEGSVYVYASEDSLVPKYIYYRSKGRDTLLIKRLDPSLRTEQVSRWKIVSNGVKVYHLELYHRDSVQEVKSVADIEYEDVFPFRVRDSMDVVLFKVHWDDPLQADRSYTVIKNRRFEDRTHFLYNGRRFPAVRMSVTEVIDDHQKGTLEIKLSGWELYAEDLGLVAWQKKYRENVIQSYRLIDRKPPEEMNIE